VAAVAVALEIVLAIAAIVVARADRAHRWAAALFGWVAAGDVFQAIAFAALRDGPKPHAGAARALFHLAYLVAFSRELGFAAACVWYFGRRSPWPVLLLLGAAWAPTLNYPAFSGPRLRDWFFAVVVGSQAVAWAFGIRRLLGREAMRVDVAHHALIVWGLMTMYLVVDTRFLTEWSVAGEAVVIGTAAAIGVHARRLVDGVT
jgi:hypothetical protein